MVTYDVSLQMISNSELNDSEFKRITNIDADIIRKIKKHNKIIWIVDIGNEYESLENGFSDLISFAKSICLQKTKNELSYYLRIGVFHDTITSTTTLNNNMLSGLIAIMPNINIEIISYPCSDE